MVQKKVVRYFGKKVDKKFSRPETYIRKKSGYFRQFFFHSHSTLESCRVVVQCAQNYKAT